MNIQTNGAELKAQVNELRKTWDYEKSFTVEEVRALIRVLFPNRTVGFYTRSHSYGLKHLIEKVSQQQYGGIYKYCSNETLIEAFRLEGYRLKQIRRDSKNYHFNIHGNDWQKTNKLFNLYLIDLNGITGR